MNQSDDPELQGAVITCYLDESGGADADPVAVLGGLLLSGNGATVLTDKWNSILAEHRIKPPLHMKEFSGGDMGNYPSEFCKLLFRDLVSLVNECKIISIADRLTPANFNKHFSYLFSNRQLMSIYGMSFFHVVMMNHDNARHNGYEKRIPYLLDRGNAFRHHVEQSHNIAMDMQEGGNFLHVGPIAFDSDTNNAPLQASDMIAWSVRRKDSEGLIGKFEPLSGLFNQDHREDELTDEGMAEMESGFNAIVLRAKMKP
ncbi:MAG TPA: DUF3800 domain-containing protein [Bryobacteraceae bacterium]|jgi:hypothetical protein